MKHILRCQTGLAIVLFCYFCLYGCSSVTPVPKGENNLVVTNVNVVDVINQRILRQQTLVINDGVIQSISSNLTDPEFTDVADIRIVDGQNGYITPGLIDMHVHMYEPAAFIMSLSHGVTHVRIMNGVPSQLEWRDKIEAGDMLGSTATVSSPIISGFKDATLHHYVETAQQARQAVIDYHQQGYDLIKAYNGLNQESLTAIVEQAKALNFPVAKHGPHGVGNMPVSALAGLQSFEHAEDIYQGPLQYKFTPLRLPKIVDDIKATNVPVTPTLNVFNQLMRLSTEKQAFLNTVPVDYNPTIVRYEASQNQVKRWLEASKTMAAHNRRTMMFLLDVTKVFHQRGVELLVGSDSGALLTPHGLATHDEMQLMQQTGMTSYEVLAAATINAAKALDREEEMGSLLPGRYADFVFTLSNPVEDLSALKHPAAVAKRGHWYSARQLNQLRDNAIASRSLWQEMTTLFEGL